MNNSKQHHKLNGGKKILDAKKNNIGQEEDTKGERRQLFDPTSGSMVITKSASVAAAASSAEKKKKKQSSKDKKKKKEKKKQQQQLEQPSRIACIAEESLIQRIKQIKLLKQQSLTDDKNNMGENDITNNNNNSNNSSNDELMDLPKEMINTLPEVPYKRTKKIALVTNATASNVAVALIRKELLTSTSTDHHHHHQQQVENDNNNKFHYLGFDIETRPKFHKGGTNNPPALLQLATSTTAYLFRLKYDGMNQTNNSCPMTKELLHLLSDTTIIKVGIGIQKDIIDIKSIYGRDCCGDGTSYLDLTALVKLKWPRLQRCGLRNLTATVLQYRLSKAQQMKNWEIKVLTRAMIEYAGADAFVALDLLGAVLSL